MTLLANLLLTTLINLFDHEVGTRTNLVSQAGTRWHMLAPNGYPNLHEGQYCPSIR
jgi:hypothetical protein